MMINVSDLLTIQLLLQSFPHQEITALRSGLFSGQFSSSINMVHHESTGLIVEWCYVSDVLVPHPVGKWYRCDECLATILLRTHCLFLLMGVWKRLTFYKFWYSKWYHRALWKMLSALQQSFVCHVLSNHICVHKIILWICRRLDGELFSSAMQTRSRFHFLAIFSDTHKQQVSFSYQRWTVRQKLDHMTSLSLQRIFNK